MELITKELEEELAKHPLYSNENTPLIEQEIIVKYFNPYGVGTWLITEAEKQDNGVLSLVSCATFVATYLLFPVAEKYIIILFLLTKS